MDIGAFEQDGTTSSGNIIRPSTNPAWVTGLCLIVGTAACLFLTGFTQLDSSKPLSPGGDSLFVLNFIKNYINGYGFRVNPSLGYPGMQDNLFFPSFDFTYRAFLRMISFAIKDVNTCYYVMYFAGIMTMYVAAFFAFQKVGISIFLSTIGGVVYVVSPFLGLRSFGHDFLALYYSAPLGCTLAIILAHRNYSSFLQSFRDRFSAVSILICATSGLYYAFFTCMFVVFAGVVGTINQRTSRPLLISMLTVGSIVVLLLISGYGLGLPEVINGHVVQIRRLPLEQFYYGLSLGESTHVFSGFPLVGAVFTEYLKDLPQVSGANGLFEWPGPVLTLVILLSPVISALRVTPTERSRNLLVVNRFAASCILFGLLYALRGGLAFYFNNLISPNIRATARIIPFLSFFALVIVLSWCELALRLNKSVLWRWVVPTTAIALLLLSIVPTVNVLAEKQKLVLSNASLMENIESIKAFDQAKDDAGLSTVLQLPVMSWPEVGPQRTFDAYLHQLPFIYDRVGSRTRWTYGSTPSQVGYGVISNLVKTHSNSGLALAASQLGINGLVIEKAGYTPQEIFELEKGLETDGQGQCIIFSDRFRVAYKVGVESGAAHCLKPPARVDLTFEEKSEALSMLGMGWTRASPQAMWTDGIRSTITLNVLPNQAALVGKSELRFSVLPYLPSSLPKRQVNVSINGKPTTTWTFDRSDWTVETILIPENVVPGQIEIELTETETRSPQEFGESDDPRHLALALREVEWRAEMP